MNKENTGGTSYQDSPHKEGAYGNTAASKPSGQNISHNINEMNQDSEEQIKGRTESDNANNNDDNENSSRQGNSSI